MTQLESEHLFSAGLPEVGGIKACCARLYESDWARLLLGDSFHPGGLALTDHIFMIMLQDFMDPWTFNQKNLMKCCKEILLPDGKQIPFCAYNNVGYREQARTQLAARQRARAAAEQADRPFEPPPLTFDFGRAATGETRRNGHHNP